MISVLVPSRERSDMLIKSIYSLGPGDYEVLVAIDKDDPEIDTYKNVVSSNVRVFITERHGYENLHEYYNLLAKKAKGKWLMLWNDDATMLTVDWVSKIEAQDHTEPIVLNLWKEQDNLFPVISRAWYQAVGHFSMNTHADSWVQQVGELLGRTKYIKGIDIKHLGEELSDPTHQRVRSVVMQTSEAYRRMEEERKEDARKINEYLNKRG